LHADELGPRGVLLLAVLVQPVRVTQARGVVLGMIEDLPPEHVPLEKFPLPGHPPFSRMRGRPNVVKVSLGSLSE
jgi:hypothetical protein